MQEHIIINEDRSVNVPQSVRKIGVQYDHNVNTITFDCPRYSGKVDLSTLIFYVNYLLSDNSPGSSKLENIVVDEENPDMIHFDWTIRRAVTTQSGGLKCLVCGKKTDAEGIETNHWNTDLFNTMYVTEGLETEAEIEEENKDLITQLLLEMDTTDENLLNLSNRVGELSNLTTDDKSSVVAAVNEVKGETTELKGDLSQLSKEMIDVKGATVGQIIKVSAVDDTGKPITWEPATPPSKLTDFKNDLYFSKEELFLTLTKNDFEYDENEEWALYVSNPNTTFAEDGNGFAYKVNVSIGGKTYTNSGTYSDFKMKDSDPPSIHKLFSTDDQSDFIETDIRMSGGYNAKTDDENYSGFSIIINDYDVTWLDVDDFMLELCRIEYKKIPIDIIDFGDFFNRLTHSDLFAEDEVIFERDDGGYKLFPLIYVSGLGFYTAMDRYSSSNLEKTKTIHQYTIDPNVIGYNFSLDVGQTYTSPTTNNMRIYEAGNSSEMSANDIFAMSESSGSGNIIFDATINGTKVRSVACQSLYNKFGSTDFKAYSMLADGDKLYSICAERVGTSGTISVKRLM